ncbi:MAG: phosphoglycerate kinase [Hydrotalea sp.]|nr:phosphoglycerate kinase [Hydrotalea sp.]
MLQLAKNYHGKNLLVRADLNLPIKNGVITDDTRLVRFLPSIKNWQAGGAAKIIVLSHLGRPKGKNESDSLKPIAAKMAALLAQEVMFLPDCIGDDIIAMIKKSSAKIFLAENLRFHAGEEGNDEGFATSLAGLGDVYINDAFSVSHRKHASVYSITKFLPSFAGPSLLAEVSALEKVLVTPQKPVMAIVGGAKISSKIAILEFLLPRLDHLVIGGAMANTFLRARGLAVGKSLVEDDQIPVAQKIMAMAADKNCKIHLPLDVVVADKLATGARVATKELLIANAIADDEMILDVGDKTIADITATLKQVKTLLWNGPLGAFETAPFDRGTVLVARAAAALTREKKLLSVAGGGDTASAMNHAGVADDLTYLSTAGGAFLEWLEGKELPGVAALQGQ